VVAFLFSIFFLTLFPKAGILLSMYDTGLPFYGEFSQKTPRNGIVGTVLALSLSLSLSLKTHRHL
jgi:hypothetical protein